jgi:ATP-dependent Lhr-like helicase
LTILGPTTATALAETLGVAVSDIDEALLTLEMTGVAMRGRFTGAGRILSDPARGGSEDPPYCATNQIGDAGSVAQAFRPAIEWCDRSLLARIHRYTLNRLRAEIEPVTPADFMRFLFVWQHVEPAHRLVSVEGLRAIVEQLDGVEISAEAWERSVLPTRMDGYEPALLDTLCLSGEVGWARLSGGEAIDVSGATPIALFMRDGETALKGSATDAGSVAQAFRPALLDVLNTLRERGPSFAHELARTCALDDEAIRTALGHLVAAGLAASDGFGGLRWLLRPAAKPSRTQAAGRWTVLEAPTAQPPDVDAVDASARALLTRYGIVCRRLLAREPHAPAWRDLVQVYRRLEARGEIRGGRFVSGLSGEQFARPDAIERLREIRRSRAHGQLITISAADPLNLTGIVTSGDRVRASASARIVYRDGQPVASLEGDFIRPLTALQPDDAGPISAALTGRALQVVSGFVGRQA